MPLAFLRTGPTGTIVSQRVGSLGRQEGRRAEAACWEGGAVEAPLLLWEICPTLPERREPAA